MKVFLIVLCGLGFCGMFYSIPYLIYFVSLGAGMETISFTILFILSIIISFWSALRLEFMEKGD